MDSFRFDALVRSLAVKPSRTCARTFDCPAGEQCADCQGNTHCLPLCLG